MAKKRKVQPKFFLFILILAVFTAGVVFVGKMLSGKSNKELIMEANATPVPEITDVDEKTDTFEPSDEEYSRTAVSTPAPALTGEYTVRASSEANPALFGFTYRIQANRNDVDSYQRPQPISFGATDTYTNVPGILTFGGNHYRNTFSYGTASTANTMMRRVWEQSVGSIDSWSGTGWTGEPLIIQWPAEVRYLLGVSDEFRNKANFTEVIYPAMDGKIYFFELETGNKTRNPIDTGVVMKSTACLDPRGWPVLYVGQSIPGKNSNKQYSAYVTAYDLIKNEEITKFGGYDYFGKRAWQAYDSSPIIIDDTMIYGGENGVLYTVKLNTNFDPINWSITIQPERLVKYAYTGSGYSEHDSQGYRWLGIESSVSCFRNYAFFADNGGRLQCIDLNTMSLMYVCDMNEDADASVLVDESYGNNTIFLYAGSQVKTAMIDSKYGYSYHRCFDGLTGQLRWEQKWLSSLGNDNSSGGTIATAQAGRGNVSDYVYFSMNQTVLDSVPVEEDGERTLGGRIVAYQKTTGNIIWTVEQKEDYWSSPVLIYDENNKGYLVQCDRAGMVRLYDAKRGTELCSINLGSRIDSTPSVFNGYLVVGTRGKGGSGENAKILCVAIS